MSQQQPANDVSIDEIPTDISNTQSGEIEPAEVPVESEFITRGLVSEQPPTNPLVVHKAARWWYIHGKGGSDPVFEGARHLATDVEWFDEFRKYLVTVGFADEAAALR